MPWQKVPRPVKNLKTSHHLLSVLGCRSPSPMFKCQSQTLPLKNPKTSQHLLSVLGCRKKPMSQFLRQPPTEHVHRITKHAKKPRGFNFMRPAPILICNQMIMNSVYCDDVFWLFVWSLAIVFLKLETAVVYSMHDIITSEVNHRNDRGVP